MLLGRSIAWRVPWHRRARLASLSAVWRFRWRRALPPAGDEHLIADVPDGLVKVAQGVHDVLPVRLAGRVQRGLQAPASLEEVADDPAEQVLAGLRRASRGSSLPRRQPGGEGRLPGRVDRDQQAEPVQAQDPADDIGRRHQPQLRAAGHRWPAGADQGLGGGGIVSAENLRYLAGCPADRSLLGRAACPGSGMIFGLWG
jgi:hypothetical protein